MLVVEEQQGPAFTMRHVHPIQDSEKKTGFFDPSKIAKRAKHHTYCLRYIDWEY